MATMTSTIHDASSASDNIAESIIDERDALMISGTYTAVQTVSNETKMTYLDGLSQKNMLMIESNVADALTPDVNAVTTSNKRQYLAAIPLLFLCFIIGLGSYWLISKAIGKKSERSHAERNNRSSNNFSCEDYLSIEKLKIKTTPTPTSASIKLKLAIREILSSTDEKESTSISSTSTTTSSTSASSTACTSSTTTAAASTLAPSPTVSSTIGTTKKRCKHKENICLTTIRKEGWSPDAALQLIRCVKDDCKTNHYAAEKVTREGKPKRHKIKEKGCYVLILYGAAGGAVHGGVSVGGVGAMVAFQVTFERRRSIYLWIGKSGSPSTKAGSCGGGGGGTVVNAGEHVLGAAAGGGGACHNQSGLPGALDGGDAVRAHSGRGGRATGGAGAGGGGGWREAGAVDHLSTPAHLTTSAKKEFFKGGSGVRGGGDGGFGGGGGGSNVAGGGGGGYTGGDSGNQHLRPAGRGGFSYCEHNEEQNIACLTSKTGGHHKYSTGQIIIYGPLKKCF